MTGVLSDRQRDELHRSLLEYLHASEFSDTYDALKRDAGLDAYAPDPKSRYAGLLEKKWLSTIRLQKKNMELENKVRALEKELDTTPNARRGAFVASWHPSTPRHTLLGHRQPITDAAFHPRFSMLATASEDMTIKIWDWETGELEQTLKGHTKPVQSIAFDYGGKYLVSCSSDLAIKIWDITEGWKNVRTMHGHEHSVSSACFLPGDQHIISASRDRTLKLWETATGFCTRTLRGHSDWVRAVTVSSDARLFASASSDRTVRIWDAGTGEMRNELRGHEHVVECVMFAPATAYAALCALGGIRAPRDESAAHSGQFLASGSRDKTIRLWTQQGQCIRVLAGHDNWVRALAFSPNGKYLLSVSDDKTMRVWDLASGRCIKAIDAHNHFCTSLAWGRSWVEDNQVGRPVNVVATGSVDLGVKVWAP
ncbi:Lissencephaly-1 [Malassezia vespertilionis]|uniref:Nuclear distribution protein PAC1 n=1 Tax=Malassezia vespertilionis TaxID=2020962 RepID=A0A2N1JF54_9BASI|nr:Lissencephaly-1 [Malassezia vespertilionis]PKI85179.1 Pac1p [Malassezia vespertilionis]WFD05605.1 Lissencephaly-1 [Malassezia vespertilionis]